VLGGVTTFLFASVVVSGARVLALVRFTRRARFVLAAALSFGLGDVLAPTVFTHLFDSVKSTNSGLQGFLSSVEIVLSTPCECRVALPRGVLTGRPDQSWRRGSSRAC
jgi:xanthine/uracil permease